VQPCAAVTRISCFPPEYTILVAAYVPRNDDVFVVRNLVSVSQQKSRTDILDPETHQIIETNVIDYAQKQQWKFFREGEVEKCLAFPFDDVLTQT
jgi:hypothetical protein